MIDRAVLSRIDRPATQGRTRPIPAAIETVGGEVDVHVKLSAGCGNSVIPLAREVIAACLAADLGLPVPRPLLVEIQRESLPAVIDADVAGMIEQSAPVSWNS